jgi:hypothetical protein
VLLNRLRLQVSVYVSRNWILLADSGFDGKNRYGDIIPPARRGGALKDLEQIVEQNLWLKHALMESMGNAGSVKLFILSSNVNWVMRSDHDQLACAFAKFLLKG